jgi:hypothetical protein
MDEADCPRPLLGRDQPDRERLETRCNQNANLPSQRGYLADALRQGRATLSSPTAMQPRAASVPRRQPSARAWGPALPCLRAPGQDGAAQREDGQVRAKRSAVNNVSGLVLDTDRPIHRCTDSLPARRDERQGACHGGGAAGSPRRHSRRSGSRGGRVGPLHRRPLQAFGLAVQVSRWVLASKFPRGMVWDYVRLPDQAQRAAGSMALNIKRPPRLVGSRRRTWRVVCRSPASVIPRQGPCGAGQAEPPYGPSPAARAFAASGFARWSEIAYASASEACSALDPVDLPGATEQQQYLRELGAVRMDAMLTGLMR